MFFASLVINDFRNFSQEEFRFSQGCNIFYGANGSGKTSILEAIYYLILGRSFRNHLLKKIIRYGQNELVIFGKVEDDREIFSIGISRSVKGGKQLKLNGGAIQSSIEIARLIPVHILNQEGFLLLEGEPGIRRKFMDWGLFHVERSYLDIWRKAGDILKQRNAAIRERARVDYIKMWDREFVSVWNKVHEMRKKYLSLFNQIVIDSLKKLLPGLSVEIEYFQGWELELDLTSALEKWLRRDLLLGYTTVGPHRADMQIKIQGRSAKDFLSRGQQKMVIYAFQIAQGVLVKSLTNKSGIYLVDDILAELDSVSSNLILELLLADRSFQFFFTALESNNLEQFFASRSIDQKIFNIINRKFN